MGGRGGYWGGLGLGELRHSRHFLRSPSSFANASLASLGSLEMRWAAHPSPPLDQKEDVRLILGWPRRSKSPGSAGRSPSTRLRARRSEVGWAGHTASLPIAAADTRPRLPERVQISKQTTADLMTFVLALTRFVNTKRAHVPLMTEEADVGGAGGEGGTGKGKGYWGWRVLAGRGE